MPLGEASSNAFFIVNTVISLILMVLVIITLVFYVKTQRRLSNQFKSIEMIQNNTEVANTRIDTLREETVKIVGDAIKKSATTMTDLLEFKDLNPIIKAKYREYIVDIIMPALMKYINTTAEKTKLIKSLTENDNQLRREMLLLAEQIQVSGPSRMIF